jgi:Ca2+:H+ antiporter
MVWWFVDNFLGSRELRCDGCPNITAVGENLASTASLVCKSCFFVQPHPTTDPLYQSSTKYLMYICSSVLVLVYAIGLWFTLRYVLRLIGARTHSKQIYDRQNQLKKRQETLHKTIMKQIVKHERKRSQRSRGSTNESQLRFRPGQSVESSAENLGVPVVDVGDDSSSIGSFESDDDKKDKKSQVGHGGPNWGTYKSCAVLLISTLLFSAIAEVLISCVDVVLENVPGVDEKFLGLTLFALIPSVTEFYNAIAFAMQGNIVLALEIGGAYTIQVALLQIPALVALSAWFMPIEVLETYPGSQIMSLFYGAFSSGPKPYDTRFTPFTLIFPVCMSVNG